MANWEKLIEEHYSKKNKIDENTIFELIEQALLAEGYQDSEVIKNYPSMRLSTKGTKKAGGDPYDEDPPKARSKSAPAGFGSLEETTLDYTHLAPKKEARIQLFITKIQNGDPFELVSGGTVVLPAEKNQDLLDSLKGILDGTPLTGSIFAVTDQGETIDTKKLKKTGEFGGKGGAVEPNRGEVAEAFLACAIVLRFRNLPLQGEGAPSYVTPSDVLEFLKNDVALVTLPPAKKGQKPNKALKHTTNLSTPTGKTDKIVMNVVLRGFSMDGLMPEQGVIGDFVKNDGKLKNYLRGACEYANNEVINWAIGSFEGAKTEEQGIGWFINDTNNVIFVGAVGTGDQKGTKVDLRMTCEKASKCPLGKTAPMKGTMRLQSLSLKAGATKHIGQAGARYSKGALGLMEDLFGPSLRNRKEWADKFDYYAQFIAKSGSVSSVGDEYAFIVRRGRNGNHKFALGTPESGPTGETKVFASPQEAKKEVSLARQTHAQMLRDLISQQYLPYVQRKLGGRGSESETDDNNQKSFLKQLALGIKRQAVLDEEGVDLVQFDDKGSYQILDFYQTQGVVDNLELNLDAALKPGDGDVPYLVIYDASEDPEDKDGNRVRNITDDNTLIRVRPLQRTGAPLIRVEKGELLKKNIAKKIGTQRKRFRQGKVVDN